ncbi:MAG: hypothetical protein RL702_950 [Pseudomonadota bacterium]|jgi:uncharacterized membrane protein YhaH (DUF805 family)|nr:DUF805 domain-containing protein [Novosphingobium sp.]HOA50557.1 DUF805 domain-containing protein [Novosphingobium sp.]HPZ46043.1 DUF805 domain-containing protein [Novosphingobium sp.]HQE00588.1 DUF805 domain-containing protein [Novosphingobium sp.]HQN54279.1 DUF805 domain-containing protein [Novosphingobium sp.]
MLGSIRYNLANLANFSGRDARQTFWYYVLFLYLIQMVAGMLVAIPMMVAMFSQMFAGVRAGADPDAVNAMMLEAMSGPLETTMWLALGLGAVSLLALAASFVRRLHDSGLSGWWAWLPGLLYVGYLVWMPRQIAGLKAGLVQALAMQQGGTPFGMMPGQEAAMLSAYLPLILLAVFGVRKSHPGPNRFGETPVRF